MSFLICSYDFPMISYDLSLTENDITENDIAGIAGLAGLQDPSRPLRKPNPWNEPVDQTYGLRVWKNQITNILISRR